MHKTGIKQEAAAKLFSRFVWILAADKKQLKRNLLLRFISYMHAGPIIGLLECHNISHFLLLAKAYDALKDNICKQQYTAYSNLHTKAKKNFATKVGFLSCNNVADLVTTRSALKCKHIFENTNKQKKKKGEEGKRSV